MVLNQYCSNPDEIGMIIEDNILNLCSELRKKEKIEISPGDFEYSFFDRVEKLAVRSSKIYPGEDLPRLFGVQRGYNGGGIHSGLIQTETYRMTPRRAAKAERMLSLIKKYFWQILEDCDNRDEETTGETKQPWDKLTL